MWPPTENEWLAIGQAVTALTALFAWLQSRTNAKRQTESAKQQAINNLASRAAIQEIHLTINSRLTEFKEQSDKLLHSSIEAAHAKGLAEGRKA